ncbi:unnamed protein product [Albugo candida]|uniref:AAA+ ATPase domain-containing protein n=2 Tax=Albugo candida TaxID=65357 RepID=A0A024G8M4_9STRA|nr:unnamed protein product [Albugo candida]|eukprot:CCI43009.1 unnamed protein product [Albugo candida]
MNSEEKAESRDCDTESALLKAHNETLAARIYHNTSNPPHFGSKPVGRKNLLKPKVRSRIPIGGSPMVPRAPNMQYKSSAKRPEELGAGRKESLNPQSFAPGRFLLQDVETQANESGIAVSGNLSVVYRSDRPMRSKESFTASLNLDASFLREFKSGNFIYLRRKKHLGLVMYDLEVAEHEQIDRADYFTMSMEGITHFTANHSEFWTLQMWETEYARFHAMLQISFFKQYKIWKTFIVWKKTIRFRKIRSAKRALTTKLVTTMPFVQNAILQLRKLCLEIADLELIYFEPGHIYTLEAFEREQNEYRDTLTAKLREYSEESLKICIQTCTDVIDDFMQANQIAAESSMTFMERAALRKEYRKLSHFLRLIDFLFIDATLQLTIKSFRNLYEALTGSIPIVTSSNTKETKLIAAGGKQESNKGTRGLPPVNVDTEQPTRPLFKVTVESEAMNSLTSVVSAVYVLPSQEAWNFTLQRILKETIKIVETSTRHLGHEALKRYTIEENEEVTSDLSSGKLTVALILNYDAKFNELTNDIFALLEEAIEKVEEYLDVFTCYDQIFIQNRDQVVSLWSRFEHASVESVADSIEKLQAQKTQLLDIPVLSAVGIFQVDSTAFKCKVVPTPQQCIRGIQDLLPQLMKKKSTQVLDLLNELSPLAYSNPNTPDLFVKKIVHMQKVSESIVNLKTQYRRIFDLGILMDSNEWKMPDELKENIILMKEGVLALENMMTRFEGEQDADTVKFAQQVADSAAPLNRQAVALREKLDHIRLASMKTPVKEALAFLEQQKSQLDQLKNQSEKLAGFQTLLKQPVMDFEELNEVSMYFDLKYRLWSSIAVWDGFLGQFWDIDYRMLDVNAIQKEASIYSKTAHQAHRTFPGNEAAKYLFQEVEKFNRILPIVSDLRNTALQERHWRQIHDLVGFVIHDVQGQDHTAAKFTEQKCSSNLSLGSMIEKNMMQLQPEISKISITAQHEAILEDMLQKISTSWSDTEFEIKLYKDSKDVFILGSMEDITTKMDDSTVAISAILGSRYIGGIQAEVESWKKKLAALQELLDVWLAVQKNWLYLEPIFAAPDIQRQLPDAGKIFSLVDTSWKSIMRRVNESLRVMSALSIPGITETLTQHDANLDIIQKRLEDYLETKRMAFPRFYFLSNDELLEILSQSKNPQSVQPHLRKCFENLVKVDFGENSASIDMLAMISSEGERVPLGRNLKARGNVEDWLKALEASMKSSIHKSLKKGLLEYQSKERVEWLCDHPGQIVATVAQIMWAWHTEEALNGKELDEDRLTAASGATGTDESRGSYRMQEWFDRVLHDLNQLILKIRQDLTPLQRKVIVSLITTDVHARDIVEELWRQNIDSVSSFIWQQQLRYYWDTQTDDVIIRHADSSILYGYEYMGATSRLVITPLTDRCWMTLTGSFTLKLGAAPAGPAGTGKTESSKDLAKAMAIQCVVFNCSDQIDYKMMGKLFRGLAQAGNWTCLDEFNRIDIEVLSVVAQQLLILREGRLQQKEHINFMGVEITLKDHHVIVTMNPGYAGRTELPDNLKVCFRPVSMMVPDYALIAEIMLFAEGFSDARILSRKMCRLYILCSEQLSQQPHYDYGLRAVKSVLVMAGNLKRSNPDIDENITLIRALRDSNIPKFLSDDIPLFQAIVADLFPNISIPPNDYGDFVLSLRQQIRMFGFQSSEAFDSKVIQLLDTLNVRFGAALVGPTGAGKTSCYRVLQATMTSLRNANGSGNPIYQLVETKVLNPKCISMGELYGEFNEVSQEWHDGLASSIMREAVIDESDSYKWTVFDGPIDALWIENLNTVLDDNMTLCLANGERIKLKNQMKMLFEVMDLTAASPATVSRIGVVYMNSRDLGYSPFIESWIAQCLPKDLSSEGVDRIRSNIDLYLDKIVQFLRKNCGMELVATTDLNLVTSFCKLFQFLLIDPMFKKPESTKDEILAASPIKRSYYDDTSAEELVEWIDKLFLFALCWSVGASVSSEYHPIFDTFVRDLFEMARLQLPSAETIMDYFPDCESRSLVSWKDVVPKFQYNAEIPYFQIIVPTTDTVRLSSILKLLIKHDRPAYITGVTGTGKTVVIQQILEEMSRPACASDTHLEHSIAERMRPFVKTVINFSAQTSSLVTQLTIESKLEKKRRDCIGPAKGAKMILFIDDINLPAVEQYGAQPPIELLRQFLDFKGFYDREKLFWKEVQDTLMLVAAAPAGGGRSNLTPRFIRHFHVLSMYPSSEAGLKLIFGTILRGFLERFSSSVRSLSDEVVTCIVGLYSKITQELLPIPSKFYYTFNLRDLSKVFRGLLMITPHRCNDVDTMHKLWIHECTRVFQDRLNTREDQRWFEEHIVGMLQRSFGCNWTREAIFHGACPLLFADYLRRSATADTSNSNRLYEFCSDINLMTKALDDFLHEYNEDHSTRMNLVFFRDAIAHITRLARILRQPRGHAMLIGVGGSGKQSITRLASYIVGATCEQIEITRGYGITEFREDLKKILLSSGVQGHPVVFLFADSQIVDGRFLEDLNNILNSGEVPNLFAMDETDRIISDMRPVMKELGLHDDPDSCLQVFTQRVRDYLHIVLAMSPVGSALRVRCRAFPSLINCCTIDCYMNWPKEALQSVADRMLAGVAFPSKEIRAGLVSMCSTVHTTSDEFNQLFLQHHQRHVYTTPKSYLGLISLYVRMLQEKRKTLQDTKNRMEIGVKKLKDTNSIVDSLKSELIQLKPVLQEKTTQVEVLLEQITIDRQEAARARDIVARDEPEVILQAEQVAIIQADAQKDLDVAMPALNNAVKALDALSKNDITEVKSFAKPPEAVETVMNAVCLLLNEKQTWESAKKVLSEGGFLDRLKSFDKDNIPPSALKKLSKHAADPVMAVENVSKVSKAATSLCMWVHAILVYSTVAKEVGPKRSKLEELNAKLNEANTRLKEKQDELFKVDKNLAILQQQCDEAVNEKNGLTNDAAITEQRLVRAEALISGLSVEGARWKRSVASLEQSNTNLIGDIFLAAACIAYYGPFNGSFRQKMATLWLDSLKQLQIPCSSSYSLNGVLSTPTEIRQWQLNGLPTDSTSTDNAILVLQGERWPLMIDPQGQGSKWIKRTARNSKENGNENLEVIKMTNSNLLSSLEKCIRNGMQLLIEDVEETLEPSLEPILQKAVYMQNGRSLIRLADSDIDYDANFRMILTTKLSNPHYSPEVYIKVTIINFTVTMDGLEDQLLGDVVRSERLDIEEKKNTLIASMAQDTKQLEEIEDRILKKLSESSGNVLDDQDLIDTLQSSNTTSNIIKERVTDSEATEIEINRAREQYRVVATRGTIIYFVVAQLSVIDPMYQYSLPYFQRLFNYCLNQKTPTDNLSQRLEHLIQLQTHYIYLNICRGLFEAHKILFSILICTKIMLHSGLISPREWALFLRGSTSNKHDEDSNIQASGFSNPAPEKLSASQWDLLLELDSLETSGKNEGKIARPFEGILHSVMTKWSDWLSWVQSADFSITPCPEEKFEQGLNSFQKVLLLKAIAEERVLTMLWKMISTEMGEEFIRSTSDSMEEIYDDTDNQTPCIFILSAGADPTGMLLRFAKQKNYIDRLNLVSLGQGQGPRAEKLIETSRSTGEWVLLQNCHLAKSWMSKLEAIVNDMSSAQTPSDPNFRLFLTSFPVAYFPVTVLQNGIKLTNEPPKGIRANMVRSFTALISPDTLSSMSMTGCFESEMSKDGVWRKLLISLSIFHAVVQERRKFGALGWNIKYEFNDADLETSISSLKRFLHENSQIPWDALRYVTGQINYGGRVTDDWDRRCLMSILSRFYDPSIVADDIHLFCASGRYRVPESLEYGSILQYLNDLPIIDDPELFGMNENAIISYERNESITMIRVMLSLEPRDTVGSLGISNDKKVLEIAQNIQTNLPDVLSHEEAGPTTFKTRQIGDILVMDSIATVLSQEIVKFNALLQCMSSSLIELQRAINGLSVMSSDLDHMYTALLNSKVPPIWAVLSFASLKPLGSWVQDLLARVGFFRNWLRYGEPNVFEFGAFFFPQGFMTGVLQNFARKYQVAIDSLSFTFGFSEDYNTASASPEDGVYISGLWLEGARWSTEDQRVEDAQAGEMFSPMTAIHFLPAINSVRSPQDYPCPVYKTSSRQGTLSTTGISTNYVVTVFLPTLKSPDFWTMRGAALMLNLDV